uniref:zinc ribbon domain-containing protein n=1 Tax=Lentzea kentuckyensis TaxID=360086 RepID=UPI001B803147
MKPVDFREAAAQPFDDVQFTGSADQLSTLRTHRRGESDLLFRDGAWFLIAACEVPETPQFEPTDWIGVDRGIALEEFQGIRDRVRLHRHQRATQSSWPFYQLERQITYKARRAGVPVLLVDARYTSQMCPMCKHTSRSNRPARDSFSCRWCGLAGPADFVAAVNIRDRARRAWVLVNVPYRPLPEQLPVDAARTPQPVADEERDWLEGASARS